MMRKESGNFYDNFKPFQLIGKTHDRFTTLWNVSIEFYNEKDQDLKWQILGVFGIVTQSARSITIVEQPSNTSR